MDDEWVNEWSGWVRELKAEGETIPSHGMYDKRTDLHCVHAWTTEDSELGRWKMQAVLVLKMMVEMLMISLIFSPLRLWFAHLCVYFVC